MAFLALAPMIDAEHFDDDCWGFGRDRSPHDARTKLDAGIERAIAARGSAALEAIAAAIDLLDELDGDPDQELVDEREGEELYCAHYGVNQTEPLGLKAARRRAKAAAAQCQIFNAKGREGHDPERRQALPNQCRSAQM